MNSIRLSVLIFFFLFIWTWQGQASEKEFADFQHLGQEYLVRYEPVTIEAGSPIIWNTIAKGLDTALLSHREYQKNGFFRNILIRVLRFDTSLYDFRLFSSLWEKDQSVRTIREWASQKKLTSATNACMFQKDGKTSTGYMRSGEVFNNPHIAQKYGSFFVSGPREPGLPRAAVLDRDLDDWQTLLPLYETVVQNFRLMGSGGEQLWPKNGPLHAVAAVAEDMNGRILFLHCNVPVSVYAFVEALNNHTDLNLNSAMYVEGGREAALLLNLPEYSSVWSGMTPADYMLSPSGDDIPLPNILGVVPK